MKLTIDYWVPIRSDEVMVGDRLAAYRFDQDRIEYLRATHIWEWTPWPVWKQVKVK